jgi:hypothetical protein
MFAPHETPASCSENSLSEIGPSPPYPPLPADGERGENPISEGCALGLPGSLLSRGDFHRAVPGPPQVSPLRRGLPALGLLALAALAIAGPDHGAATARDVEPADPQAVSIAATSAANRKLLGQTPTQMAAKSRGCETCHAGIEPMHLSAAVKLGCVDCHGGNSEAAAPAGATPGSPAYDAAKLAAHVAPTGPWGRPGDPSANPERSYAAWLRQSAEFVKFVNPGDLRVAQEACGGCHQEQINATLKSPMRTAATFWAAAGYANGVLPSKRGVFGEAYGRDGQAQGITEQGTIPAWALEKAGALRQLLPLPRWQVTTPGEYFRAFERGGLLQPAIFPDIGNPSPKDDAGRPDIRLSDRGPGTGLRISPALINLQKTRLNDPHLSMLGTNDHAGDFRSSGCSGCHLIYANDRDPAHSGPWAGFGHRGVGASGDAAAVRGPGHPIRHQMTRAIPTSQCMSCHMHQPNSFVNTYLGYTMWDYESDGEALWPKDGKEPTLEEKRRSLELNPEGAAARGLWSDPAFLDKVSELNPTLKHTQFADYHGHGWLFSAVYSRDRRGNLLDGESKIVPFDDPQRFQKAVHLKDIHLEKGMHCADCHFSRDSHGTGFLHAEYADAIEIECQDCHGDANALTNLRTSGPAAPPGGTDLSRAFTSFGQRRFVWREGRLVQRSTVTAGLEWPVPQVRQSIDPADGTYNPKAARAKTMQRGGTWGAGFEHQNLAHGSATMSCTSCHSSWITNCFGCHLPQEANQKSDMLRYEGESLRNYASYNPQVVRTDAYMLGKAGLNKGGKWSPVRSSSALVLSSTNLNRQRFYVQQPPISTPGFSSQAFNPHVPHTVRLHETKGCADCHVSEADDNNAWMAQLLLQGTGFVNFMGRYAWVGLGEEGLEAVAITEWDEPQAVFGSYLHRLAYPARYQAHQARGKKLPEAHHHHGGGDVQALQTRGEYLFAALGHGGFRVFDIANIDNKDFSERIVTAPVSPLGQDTAIATRDAADLLLPTNQPVGFGDRPADPTEQQLHPLFRYALVADREEGLVVIDVATLTDGEPRNNFLERAATFDPGGALRGAQALGLAGRHLYVGADAGLAVVDLDQPMAPRLLGTLGELRGVTSIAIQFRYAFVVDAQGLSVLDITAPEAPRVVARLPIAGARRLYLARTYAYVAAGAGGLVIVDIEKPALPKVEQVFDGGGKLRDVRDVKVASSYVSLFAYVADAEAGLVVVQLTSPEATPGYQGFSPRPAPAVIASYPTDGPALALSRGLDRDRAVDESGNQIAIFNRIGARPANLEEMRKLYLRDGALFKVSPDAPPTTPVAAGGSQP